MKLSPLAFAALAACGGQIADYGDGGLNPADASNRSDGALRPDTGPVPPPPPPPVACSPHNGSGFANPNGACGAESDWACGADRYGVACNCPEAKCVCTRNGILTATVTFSACPSCGVGDVGRLCPFPQ